MSARGKKRLPWAAVSLMLLLFFLFVSQPAPFGTPKAIVDGGGTGAGYTEAVSVGNGRYDLLDFYREDPRLDAAVTGIMEKLTEEELLSQMVVTYFAPRIKDAGTIVELIKTRETGGVIFFENSNREIARLTGVFTQASLRSSSLLLPVYAIDGEPSYMQQRIGRAMRLHVSEEISTVEEANKTAGTIALLLKKMGIHINYAPVCDIAYNREVIGLRSFGTDIDRVSRLSQAFIESTQSNGIVATAKHFPGHGSSEGDTHKRLVFIDGDPPELPVFEHVIEAGVISVMVGHVGVKNAGALDTGDKPSTLSRNIVTDLLKKQLGFKGIVVTDAMTMKAVRPFSMSSYRAVRAGCDMVLMPDDEELFMTKMRDEIRTDAEFREQVMESIRKIVRLKVCLGLINTDEQKKRTI